MSCEHCVKAITKAVRALPGVFDVTVDLKAKTVTTEHGSALTADKIKREIEEQGYGITD
jgi:copper chaperone